MPFSQLPIPRQIGVVALIGLINLLLTAGVALLLWRTLRRRLPSAGGPLPLYATSQRIVLDAPEIVATAPVRSAPPRTT